MAKRRGFTIDGMKQLQKNLGTLAKRVKGREALAIAYDVAEPVQKAIQNEAPEGKGEGKGTLKKAVKRKKFRQRINKPTAAFVFVDPAEAFYGRFVHDGTFDKGKPKGITPNPFFKRGVAKTRRRVVASMLVATKRLIEKRYPK